MRPRRLNSIEIPNVPDVSQCRKVSKKLSEEHPDVEIFTAAIDEGLNEKCYIVPGLGDAGDRIFATL